MYKIWHYDQWEQFDPVSNPNGGLFTQYVNTFLKLKFEAEGWPSWAKMDEDRHAYLDKVKNCENIDLDADKISKTPGKRAIAKLMLNSFWGKFGQCNNLSKIEYFTNESDYFMAITNPVYIIQSIQEAGPNMMSVTYKMQEDFVEIMGNTNAVIAAYTTAQARLTLYPSLEKLGTRVLYFDTDSIIYVSNLNKPEEFKVSIGWCLGEYTDEIKKDYGEGAYIAEFVSSGPKSYAYRVIDPATGKEHYGIRIKGFTLSHTAAKKLSFESLSRLVKWYVKHESVEFFG